MRKRKQQWELAFGTFPGVLFGFRTYNSAEEYSHVLYIGFFDILLTVYKRENE